MTAFTINVKNNNGDNKCFGFFCNSRMDYDAKTFDSINETSGAVDKVVYGVFDRRGGCVCEFVMAWYLIGGKKTPRLEVFSDYLKETIELWHIALIDRINTLGKPDFTPEEFTNVLTGLGFEDMSDFKSERNAVAKGRNGVMAGKAEEKRFIDLLRVKAALNCDLIIGGADMPASFVWDEDSEITEYGYEKYRPVLDSRYTVLKNGNIEIHCDNYKLGKEFCLAAAGYISESEYYRIFGES